MKGKITIQILEAIGNFAVESADLLEAVLSAGYGASISGIEYKAAMLKRERYKNAGDDTNSLNSKQKYYVMLAKLKRDGLVKEKIKRKRKLLFLTERGKKKLAALKEMITNRLPQGYVKEIGQKLTIVAFDIPEKERNKRDWIREVLKMLGFTMIQKSVWIGKTKVPQEFLDDLLEFRLLDFVEIFEISKSGSLRHVI